MSPKLPAPKGVPKLPELKAPRPKSLPKGAIGVALGLTAAGLTAAAGFAADRLNRDRRLALELDKELTVDPFHDDPDEEHTVHAADGVALHVEVDLPRGPDGELVSDPRPTIVLSHGYCLSSRAWVFQRRALREAGYRVVLWDQRGHGRSGTGEPDSYDIAQLGSDLEHVLAAVVPTGPIVLVGHSMGGMTMMSLALNFPEVVSQRVVGAAFVATSPGNLAGTTYGIPLLGRFISRLAPPTTVLLSGRQGLVDGTIRATRDVVDLLVDWGSFGSPVPMSIAQLTTDMIFGTRMDVISAFMPKFEAMDQREALQRFDGIEALVLSGMQDRLTPPSHSDEIVRHLPGAEHVLIPDAGHVIMLEHPDVLNEQLLALAERATRSGATPADSHTLRRKS
ncbi:pimeloyl-ACP methyl ester carboxylesterase [Kineosphaera limosa]|uniref:Putative peptidase S33 family protein n=1 Tax=Kineosphaera limosa NBRC 100340 TaxID=1184609 RepID=K6WPP2_9MICO|nr:alpha/beta hydrolase [Kineosphaera limosa]NYE02242.1 pimeloyl-ACP methyl ester carboxylesterase [Kineosphaera limosa]GAB94097.1 putative peptidase S33 family protein [Kineosphaera limosa NBRC 100340]